jgi:hypothetical protein
LVVNQQHRFLLLLAYINVRDLKRRINNRLLKLQKAFAAAYSP